MKTTIRDELTVALLLLVFYIVIGCGWCVQQILRIYFIAAGIPYIKRRDKFYYTFTRIDK